MKRIVAQNIILTVVKAKTNITKNITGLLFSQCQL